MFIFPSIIALLLENKVAVATLFFFCVPASLKAARSLGKPAYRVLFGISCGGALQSRANLS